MPRTKHSEGAPVLETCPPPFDPSTPRLSPERAFVVQLETRRAVNRKTLHGRVEHLSTGEARHFRTLTELVGFMRRFRGDAR
jgi:hypothetical protein